MRTRPVCFSSIFIEGFARKLDEITHTLQHGWHLYSVIIIACQIGTGRRPYPVPTMTRLA